VHDTGEEASEHQTHGHLGIDGDTTVNAAHAVAVASPELAAKGAKTMTKRFTIDFDLPDDLYEFGRQLPEKDRAVLTERVRAAARAAFITMVAEHRIAAGMKVEKRAGKSRRGQIAVTLGLLTSLDYLS
jgi:hypothetical protein